ncbi:MAG: lytic murein transglycosylase [Rhodospirillales bacterium]|nr:lytic murein transglycosylase [Rhodospirillales bacterium]MCW8862648.1 lytic murein transglycosylase [Rhodospirillales bacterium]MCW8951355.1 lytic murein transglycosylase [Rhodospirillales bacterium]MCW8969893.1 lytic murein transglycosylase [Rhodospirillales bacterium]MCW9002027.1 lytic murein transglycosylase [Rhodospirillales bacterium]
MKRAFLQDGRRSGWDHLVRKLGLFSLILATVAVISPQSGKADVDGDFGVWLEVLREEAASLGIRKSTVDSALGNIALIPRVIELDRRQPEFTMTFRQYMERLVNEGRVKRGHEALSANRALFNKVSAKYGVPERFLIAFWGLETDFGRYAKGHFPVIAALVTLSYDGRRSAFFRKELFNALRILDEGHIGFDDMKGSWAGAMGHFQFIPTTFNAYAVDYDGDGRRNIWGNMGDAVASAANFLSASGWKREETWGREVRLPDDFNYTLSGLRIRKPLEEWQTIGVRKVDGSALPRVPGISGSIIVPSGHAGPAFLVYGNFRTIMDWNRSEFYALAIGHLADRLAGLPELSTLGPKDETGLSFAETTELQNLLNAKGFDPGGADGIVGSKTREAIRAFQKMVGLPPDGHPSASFLDALRRNQN